MEDLEYWTIPGLAGSDDRHWQSVWEVENPQNFRRVEQENWDWPVMKVWTDRLQQELLKGTHPVILVGHSLGCMTVVHWSNRYSNPRIAGMFLVAPADAEQSPRLSFVEGFTPIPASPLPYPSVVIASSNDIYMTLDRAQFFAGKWQSEFISAGAMGHLNSLSGLGNWPVGKKLLSELTVQSIRNQ